MLETSIGQFSRLNPSDCFEKMCPIFKGLGYAAISINAFVGLYYNVIIAYCIYYLFNSINYELPWNNCPLNSIDCYQRKNLSNLNCALEKKNFMSHKNSKL